MLQKIVHLRQAIALQGLSRLGNWEKSSGESLSVEALEDGTIFHFYSLENKVSPSSGSRFPIFPDRAEGDRGAAEAFLRRVRPLPASR